MKPGDLVSIHSDYPDVPLYPGGDLGSSPRLGQDGDVVMLLYSTHHGYVKVLHPNFGECLVSKRRLRSLDETR